jgi:hypothetical protein
MKTIVGAILRILILLCVIGTAYFWATSLMDSIYTYRSPLHNQPPKAGEKLIQSMGEPATRRVVYILVDALRIDTANDASVMPNLYGLRQRGAWAKMHSRPPSYSAPSYSVIFTGAWPDVSDGPALNLEYEELPTWTQDNLFSAVHRAGAKTAVSAFNWFERLIPQNAVDAGFYTPGEDREADRAVVNAALPWLREGNYSLVFIHLDQVDYAGHYEGGPHDQRWNQAARRVDNLIGEIAAELDFQQDTLLITSDHGQIDRGGHGGDEDIVLLEPFLLLGVGVKAGEYSDVEMVDIAPTLAALLGTNIPASSQGRIHTEMLNLPEETTAILNNTLEAQQSALLQAYETSIGSEAEVENGVDITGSYQPALTEARAQRLTSERYPRVLMALAAIALTLAWFWLKRRRELPWFLGAGLVYLVLFNVRYAVLDKRTYSLSSVTSADDLILFCITTAGVALFISWSAAALLHKVINRRPLEAGIWTLDLSLGILTLLMLPILWSYILNGTVVTWTLPDFPSMFQGFLALIQALAVAAIGLVLGGVAIFAAWVRRLI